MESYDFFDPNSVENENNQKQRNTLLDNMNSLDTNYHKFFRVITNEEGYQKRVKISAYTSFGTATQIRDAESGTLYKELVGSADEDLFFKTALKTGEIPGNSSTTLFYLSPQHCMSHLRDTVSQEVITKWEAKRDARLRAKELVKPSSRNTPIMVK